MKKGKNIVCASCEVVEALELFRSALDSHPECRGDLAAAEALEGRPRRHAAFSLGRFPDLDRGEGNPTPPPPPRTPEKRLLDWLTGAAAPLKMLNPIAPIRSVGKGTGTLPASFGIHLNPELGFTPIGTRPLGDILRDGMPDVETSGIFLEMREDIEATRELTPDWVKIELPDMQGPFNIAHMVLGDDAFIAPLTMPAEWDAFMTLVVEFFIAAHQTLARWIGADRIYAHPRRFHRIAECSVNMVSKAFYLKHILPYDRRLVSYYGDVAIHPCSGSHVFHATLDSLNNVVYTEAGTMLSKMTAGSISVDEALAAIGNRPIMLGIGEELPAGRQAEVIQRIFDLATSNPRLTFGFTGLGWNADDDQPIKELHARMNDYYAEKTGV